MRLHRDRSFEPLNIPAKLFQRWMREAQAEIDQRRRSEKKAPVFQLWRWRLERPAELRKRA